MMKNKTKLSVALINVLLIWSCSPELQVTSDYDKTANFQQYKTFAMMPLEEKNKSISQLNANRIIEAIKAEMTRKGFQESASNPDLKVNAVTIMTDKKQVTATTDYYGYGGLYRPYAWGAGIGPSYTTYNVDKYTDGSLIIDIIDSSTNKLVWEGVGNREIDSPIKDPDTKIPAAVSEIMKSFPPGAAIADQK